MYFFFTGKGTGRCEEGKLVIVPREPVDYIDAFEEQQLSMVAERKVLSGILEPLREKYDYILLGTCPSLGTLTINALVAADEFIITVNPQLLAMMGMQDFLRMVVKIRKRINPKLCIAGILRAMCECIISHKHKASHPYHQHGRAKNLRQAVKSIKGHDVFQMNGRRRS